ncbi:MAG: endolytic transglycosylase MltG [bacterium]|nr:endolytic transglycosylase MltG [bacterium]
MNKLTVLTITLLVIGLFGYLIFREGTLPVNNKNDEVVVFTITPGEPLDEIINGLSDNDLIRNRLAFYMLVKQRGLERKIQAGQFRLTQSMNAYEVANAFMSGSIDSWLTVPEGLRKEEIAEIVYEQFGIDEDEFISLSTEGYMFPDTYLVPSNPTAQQMVDIMTQTFEQKYTQEMREMAAQKGYTDKEIIILASILEREAKYDSDRTGIASVIVRRYEEDYPLQIDATVQYAVGYQPREERWWKSVTTFADLEYDSPYNTYLYPGLPPAPISNPGVASIQAVLDANPKTKYKFYLSDDAGNTYFAETYEEHQRNIERYLN